MSLYESQNSTPAAIVLALGLAVGLAAGGWLVGKGLSGFRGDLRTVTVKGLVEREVKSDRAVWTLSLRRASDTLADAQQRIAADRDAVLAFLKKQGFADAEIERQPTKTLDKLARDFAQNQGERFRYIVMTSIEVTSPKVELVRTASGATEELLKSGVILDSESTTGRANPRFEVSKFNDLRPELLAAATKNARSIAEQFAADSGAKVGGIRSANQGNIQIFGTDGNDESAPFSPTSTPAKKIRVVSTFEFELK
ncbi:MAG TPA: SIMPL domain-containing protein [Usitatibacteraceae bacterium]|nr:SIMPL domain-containing protein [Usitatibacteraceae bacterium]